ncbi:MAG: hypothetical protein MZV70_44155 [Desulfobacterales bacterium]|nr:hypothetical protein [Desulfobacterales bacterium]
MKVLTQINLTVSDVTEGAACTVLTAKKLIDNDSPLMIANCDQLVNIDINVYLSAMEHDGFDGFHHDYEG